MLECILILEELVYKECLSDPPSSIYRNKLCPWFLNGLLKKFKFSFPSNHSGLYLATNV